MLAKGKHKLSTSTLELGILLATADEAGGFTPERGDWEFGTLGCAAGTPTAAWASLLSPRSHSPTRARAEHLPLAVKY